VDIVQYETRAFIITISKLFSVDRKIYIGVIALVYMENKSSVFVEGCNVWACMKKPKRAKLRYGDFLGEYKNEVLNPQISDVDSYGNILL